MTKPLYHHDAYLAVFDATVTASHPDGVVLDRSAFFPGGGGQPADTGVLEHGGGTHVARTSEVGTVHVVGHESKGKGNKRLRIALDAEPARSPTSA